MPSKSRTPEMRRASINRSKPVGAGLVNLGNTCFLNSVLQALAHCDFVINAVETSLHSDSCFEGPDTCVLCAFERHVRITRSMSEPIAPEQIVQCLPAISSSLILGEQEDAHEFLRCMVDALQRSIPQQTCNRKMEYPFSLFQGSMKNTVKCLKCKRLSTRVDPVEDLELEISQSTNLSSALVNFTAVETMTGDNRYACDHCRCKTDAQRSLKLHEIPPVLAIQLKRFSYGHKGKSTKLKHFVEYPVTLDFSRFMSTSPRAQKNNCTAYLSAIVVHHGYSLSSGHYVTYINTSFGWFKMDDATVKRCSDEEAMHQNAYILFYQAKNFAAPKSVDSITPKMTSRSASIQNTTPSASSRFKRRPRTSRSASDLLDGTSSVSSDEENANNSKNAGVNSIINNPKEKNDSLSTEIDENSPQEHFEQKRGKKRKFPQIVADITTSVFTVATSFLPGTKKSKSLKKKVIKVTKLDNDAGSKDAAAELSAGNSSWWDVVSTESTKMNGTKDGNDGKSKTIESAPLTIIEKAAYAIKHWSTYLNY